MAAMATMISAAARKESRGSHQRLDEGLTDRNDKQFLKHTLATYASGKPPVISWGDVVITKSQPGTRAYGAAGEAAEEAEKQEQLPPGKEKHGVRAA